LRHLLFPLAYSGGKAFHLLNKEEGHHNILTIMETDDSKNLGQWKTKVITQPVRELA